MAYQVLARKWRPQDFSSVVGQEPIVTGLRNALTEGRIAQAYLFSGIRGVGKTSVARVLAKALNCERGPAADPCNDCTTCRQITAGADLDVIEVDAATYSKVEQVRELTESLKYGPARDRYKVVVIDEIHRLSRQAFDALLKIVEEPPDHLVFIFATTEIEAVPATILSRCQEFHFRRVPASVLVSYLSEIAGREEIETSEAVLRLVARAGEGSVRDAVALLDQLATYGGGRIDDAEAVRILGGVDAALHRRLLGFILAGDGAGVVALVREVETEGWDPRHVFGEFLSYCRDALHLSLGAAPGDIDLPEEEAGSLAEMARESGYENLLRLLHQLLSSEPAVRRSEAGVLALEIAWLRAAELPKLTRIEELLAGGGGGAARRESKPPAPHPAARTPPTAAPRTAPVASPVEEEPPEGRPDVPVAAPAPEDRPADPPEESAAGGAVAEFLELVSRRRQPLAAHLADADSLHFEAGELKISAPPGDPWLGTALERANNRRVLEECLAAVWGEAARWRLVSGGGAPRPIAPAAADEKEETTDPLLEHPVVQTALELFGGTAATADGDEA